MSALLYSIGYATKSIENYIEQLHQYNIDVVADIRSVPYSKVFHDYHQEALQAKLSAARIRYVYLGAELGPRSKNPAHYNDHNQVQFDRLMQSDLFTQGVNRLQNGINKGFTIALTCAEKDPAICHRSLLVGWYLNHQHNLNIRHILHEGPIETQENLEQRLMQVTHIIPDMLTTENEARAQAYRQQCLDYAYIIPSQQQ